MAVTFVKDTFTRLFNAPHCRRSFDRTLPVQFILQRCVGIGKSLHCLSHVNSTREVFSSSFPKTVTWIYPERGQVYDQHLSLSYALGAKAQDLLNFIMKNSTQCNGARIKIHGNGAATFGTLISVAESTEKSETGMIIEKTRNRAYHK